MIVGSVPQHVGFAHFDRGQQPAGFVPQRPRDVLRRDGGFGGDLAAKVGPSGADGDVVTVEGATDRRTVEEIEADDFGGRGIFALGRGDLKDDAVTTQIVIEEKCPV